jgi:hypothetical protein
MIVLAGAALAAAAIGARHLLRAGTRWRARAAVDRRREEDESRDWLETGDRPPQRLDDGAS